MCVCAWMCNVHECAMDVHRCERTLVRDNPTQKARAGKWNMNLNR